MSQHSLHHLSESTEIFITQRTPPAKRQPFTEGGVEHLYSEAAVMLAFAFHLLEMSEEDTETVVKIYPDGEHAKQFDIRSFLASRGFERVEGRGKTTYGGRYQNSKCHIEVFPKSGEGDVVGLINGKKIVAECKGGAINTRHSGQVSKLRKGLSELIGQLMILPRCADRHIAVLPYTQETARLAERLITRCAAAGIEICLVNPSGQVSYVTP